MTERITRGMARRKRRAFAKSLATRKLPEFAESQAKTAFTLGMLGGFVAALVVFVLTLIL